MTDAVDEVVARLGGSLPAEVWVAMYEEPYESGEMLGVAATLERAKQIVHETYPNEKIAWSEVKTNHDARTGRTYTWVESHNGRYNLSLEEVQQ